MRCLVILFYILFLTLLMGACLSDRDLRSTRVDVSLVFTTGDTGRKDSIKVELESVGTGIRYVEYTDANGEAIFFVEPGFYLANSSHKTKRYVFNGRSKEYFIDQDNVDIELTMIGARQESLIIKEIYYSGCQGNDEKNYYFDQYITICNNSDSDQYLDSLCIGLVFPSVSTRPSTFVDAEGMLMDKLPVQQLAWQFPGTGKDYLIKSGEEVTIASNAIDHRSRHDKSVDLSKIDFAFYHPELSITEPPALGVKSMNMIWRDGLIKLFSLHFKGSAVVLFRTDGDAAEYIRNSLMRDPSKPAGSTFYAMIPQEWILDGVECVESKEMSYKRLTTVVDAGYVYCSKRVTGEGVAVRRKRNLLVVGQEKYIDTNNSFNDFEIVIPSLRNN